VVDQPEGEMPPQGPEKLARLGAAMPNGSKNKSPPSSIKFGDILESTLTKM
jgi:hypothetical protein